MANDRQKTTVYLDTEAYRRLKFVARETGAVPAELIRAAVSEYLARHDRRRRLPRSLGAGRSRSGTLSERTEDLLRGFGRTQ
ncbi:MAG: ribbon-helix-helix domain-containing protein [Acidobacteriota bacterium]